MRRVSRCSTSYRLAFFAPLALVTMFGLWRQQTATARRARVEQARLYAASEAVRLNGALGSNAFISSLQVEKLLEAARDKNPRDILWIQLRDETGTVIARAGAAASASFPPTLVWTRFENHRAVFAVLQTADAPVLLEAFPAQLPVIAQRGVMLTASGNARLGVLEIAVRLGAKSAGPPATGCGYLGKLA